MKYYYGGFKSNNPKKLGNICFNDLETVYFRSIEKERKILSLLMKMRKIGKNKWITQ